MWYYETGPGEATYPQLVSQNNVNYFGIQMRHEDAQNRFAFIAPFSTSVGVWRVGTSISRDAWHHGAFTYDSDGGADEDAVGYIDGELSSITEVIAPVGTLQDYDGDIYIGAFAGSSGTTRETEGSLAEVAFWDVELTATEMSALGAGVSPLLIRPANLVYYAPLVRGLQEVVGGGTLTANNSPTVVPHPPIYHPQSSPIIGFTAAGAAPAGTRPQNPLGHPFAGPFAGPIG
jgi:hypothetical protein